MKKLLLLFSMLFTFSAFKAQSQIAINQSVNIYNKYLIKIDSNVIHNIQATSDYLKLVSVANSINFNTVTKYYEVFTKKTLEQNIINGKLQKNLTPMAEFIFVGKVTSSPSAQINPIIGQ